jgi:transcriptional regulator with XRE-family HTH domain
MNLNNYQFSVKLIRKALKAKGKRQTELARHLGVTNQTLTNIFKSDSIQVNMLQKIAEFLDLSVFEFFADKSQRTYQSYVDTLYTDVLLYSKHLDMTEQGRDRIKNELAMTKRIIKMQDNILKRLKKLTSETEWEKNPGTTI